MTAAGDAIVATSYSQVGASENPPYSNLCSPYTDAWGAGAWCAMYVSWVDAQAGYPLPAINGPAGFSYCPSGQTSAYEQGRAVAEPEGGDTIIYSWEPWHMEGGVAICSYGVYAGAAAGDHTGHFVRWIDHGGYFVAVEGNTSASSWDNGGAVMERADRHASQVCCWARHAGMSGGASAAPAPPAVGSIPPSQAGVPAWPGVYFSNFTEHGSVATWQAQMVARGWYLGVDGQYGGESENVCIQFQSEKGLEVDGVVGPVTWDAAWTAPVT